MKNNYKLDEIMQEFENAFSRSRFLILDNINDDFSNKAGSRLGDIVTGLDTMVYKIFEPIALKHNMLILCEENSTVLTSCISSSELRDYKYLLILDSIDGTVNMRENLPFGINLAFGRIDHTKKEFSIGDIEAVFVAEYISKKSFKWIKGSDPIIKHSVIEGRKWQKNPKLRSQCFEVPDPRSYETPGKTENVKYQKRLLKLFQTIFKGKQRRAIDCTGLRMLEICDHNLIAYGDLRGATKLWDVLPSLRYLLECDGIKIYNYKMQEYSNELPIFTNKDGLVRFDGKLCNSTIIIREEFESKILKGKQYIATGKWKSQPRVDKPKIFIVFGHDKGSAYELKSVLQEKGFAEPVMLEERPWSGRAIIEKIEKESVDIGLVFVLLTPDDIVSSKKEIEKKSRDRQNIIFELGYFYGKYSRLSGQVIPLYKGGTDIFTDILGIGYIDISGGIKKAFYEIDKELEAGGWI